MNLRHTKPSFSYSDKITLPRLTSKDKVNHDSKLRYYAQILTNFINNTNNMSSQY